ncbi:MAG: HDOD domain-containing protein [Pseudomonadota bacterium]
MNKLSLDDVARQIKDLPTLPAVVMELLNTIDQDDIDIHVLAKKVSHDQALTAKTLRLANSSFYGLQVKVTTIQQAINLMGMQSVRGLITTAAMTGCFPAERCEGFDHKGFWRHSIATATCAKVLAMHLHVNQDFAFTAGLLHDLGRLALVSCFRAQYEAVIRYRVANDCYLLEAERKVLEIDHVQVGVALASLWNFSDTMIKAIAGHHSPETPGAGFLASIVHVADAIAHALDLSHVADDLTPPVSMVAWQGLGLKDEVYLQVFRETQLQFEAISTALLN